MAYCAVVIDQIGNQEYPYLYPITDDLGNMIPERWDRGLNNVVTATSIYVQRRKDGENNFVQLLSASDIKMDVYFTDSRVAFRCEKYDKGGGWTGGLTALALNAGSKMMAAHRRKGKILIGHVRYEWVREIQYNRKYNWASNEELRFVYRDNEKATWVITLHFKKETDTAFLANDTLHRASKYRLAMQDEKGEKEMEFFTLNSHQGTITPSADPKKNYSTIMFPNHYFAPKGGDKRPNW